MTKKEVRDITSDKLKELRVEKGLTQLELADKLQIPRVTVAMIETKAMGVSRRVNDQIIQAFGIDLLDQVYSSIAGQKPTPVKRACKYCPYCGGNLKQVNFYQ